MAKNRGIVKPAEKAHHECSPDGDALLERNARPFLLCRRCLLDDLLKFALRGVSLGDERLLIVRRERRLGRRLCRHGGWSIEMMKTE